MSRRSPAVRSALPRMADPRGIGVAMVVLLATIMVLDQLLALGTVGQNPQGTLTRSEVGPLPRIVSGLANVAVPGGILLIGRATWLASLWARQRPWVMVLTILIGAQAGILVGGRLLDARGITGTARRLAFDDSVLVTLIALLLVVVLGVLGRHRDTMGELLGAGARLESALTTGEQALRDEREQLRSKVRGLIETRLGPAAVDGPAFTGSQLRELAERVLRPLSRSLADTTTGFEPTHLASQRPVRWRELLRELRPEPSIRPRLLTAGMVLLTFRLSVAYFPPSETPDWPGLPQTGVTISVDLPSLLSSLLQHAATFAVVLLGTTLLARRLAAGSAPATLALRWALTHAGLATVGLATFGLIRAAHRLPGFGSLEPASPTIVLGYLLPLLTAAVVLSLLDAAGLALHDAEGRLERINADLARAVARINAQLVHERRALARRLHASVQASVNAGGLLLEQAAAASPEGRVDDAVIERVAALIERAIVSLDADDEPSLDERLAEVRSAWEDLCRIESTVDTEAGVRCDDDPVARAVVSDVVAEACANAVVHGRAQRVTVLLDLVDDEIVLTVTDDGRSDGTRSTSNSGFGTRVLETSCTTWRIDYGEHGATLRATLPVLGHTPRVPASVSVPYGRV